MDLDSSAARAISRMLAETEPQLALIGQAQERLAFEEGRYMALQRAREKGDAQLSAWARRELEAIEWERPMEAAQQRLVELEQEHAPVIERRAMLQRTLKLLIELRDTNQSKVSQTPIMSTLVSGAGETNQAPCAYRPGPTTSKSSSRPASRPPQWPAHAE